MILPLFYYRLINNLRRKAVMKSLVKVIILLFVSTVIFSCSKESDPVAKASTYQSKGMVLSAMPEDGSVVVRHDNIPRLMAAMTMGLRVKKKDVLNGIQRGDSIHFEITMAEGEMYISRIEKIK